MQHLELINGKDYYSRLRIVKIMQKIWTDEYDRKQGFRQYVLRTYGIQLVLERMDESTVTITSARVLIPARYNLFLIKWGSSQ